ncbi:hypothetical protein CEXT_66931 [Caerostris extrusa]|uniref:Uncharacterized protein n=1 Tax=Caerostris extrusa TaxID=172846 RepID=A0AAV4RNK5_CAEEX|nr:hypothetical protein CEXT_66931 [Caerostris extrusa]
MKIIYGQRISLFYSGNAGGLPEAAHGNAGGLSDAAQLDFLNLCFSSVNSLFENTSLEAISVLAMFFQLNFIQISGLG